MFEVQFSATYVFTVKVQAENAEQAEERARDKFFAIPCAFVTQGDIEQTAEIETEDIREV